MKKFFVFIAASAGLSSLHAQEAAPADYKMVDTISMSVDSSFRPSPGSITKDDKTFYLSIENPKTGEEPLYGYSRKKKNKPFSAPKKVVGKFQDSPSPAQPTLTADGLTMVYVRVTNNSWADNDLWIAYRKKKSAGFDEFRALTEVNSPSDADAYPYISPDGLQLYYVKDNDIYHASRFDEGVKFSQAYKISFPSYDFDGTGIYGVWLSPDQLHMYFVYSSAIYMASRLTTDSDWGAPTVYCFPHTEDAFISGVSFTSDMSEMYLYVSYDTKDLICKFKKQ